MIYLPGYNYLHNQHQKIYIYGTTIRGSRNEMWNESKAAERGFLVGATGAKGEVGWAEWLCRQDAATAWINHIQCMPSFFAARGGFRPKVGFQGWLRNWGLPRAGNDGGQGHSVVLVDRWGHPPLIWGGPGGWRPPGWSVSQSLWPEGP